MSEAQESWREVGKVLDGLGLKLKMHFERAQEEVERERFRDALDAAGAGVQKAFDALGEAVRDPAIRDDVRQAATSLSEAVSNTFSELGAQLRNRR
jgi:Flp pilus assembly pilin Flp